MTMTKKQKDLLCSVLFILFGLFIFQQSLSIAPVVEKDLGSGFMPKLVSVAIIAVAGLKLVLCLTEKNQPQAVVKQESDRNGGLFTILALAAYVFLFDKLGFILATALYLFTQILILSGKEKRNFKIAAAIAVVAPVAVYVLFVYLIKMPLPTGILNF